jgi:hypothetical protein
MLRPGLPKTQVDGRPGVGKALKLLLDDNRIFARLTKEEEIGYTLIYIPPPGGYGCKKYRVPIYL